MSCSFFIYERVTIVKKYTLPKEQQLLSVNKYVRFEYPLRSSQKKYVQLVYPLRSSQKEVRSI